MSWATDTTRMRKILFVTSGSIGDVVMSTGILSHLADKHPDAMFTIAGGPAAASLFDAFPRLERFIALRKQKGHVHLVSLWKNVRWEKWDIVVDLRGSLLSVFLRANERYVFWRADKTKSKADQFAALLKLDATPPARLWSSGAARERAAALLPGGREIVCLAPKTNSPKKDWPIERFAELAKRMRRDGRVFAVLATKAQQASIRPLTESLPEDCVIDLSGQTDLMTAYAIIERSSLFIGNDSGLLHMAAASGVRCVGIYGPTNDKVYAPSGPHVRIVKAREFAMGESEKRNHAYMQMIPVDKVAEACIMES